MAKRIPRRKNEQGVCKWARSARLCPVRFQPRSGFAEPHGGRLRAADPKKDGAIDAAMLSTTHGAGARPPTHRWKKTQKSTLHMQRTVTAFTTWME